MPKPAYLMFLTAFNGFVGVLLGAVGAHPLKERLSAHEMLGAWQTASHYQLAHAVGALGVLAWAAAQSERRPALNRVATCWLIGSLLFAGSLYGLALGGPRILGPITPLGGLAFLVGWGLLAIESLRRPATS